jgi:nardilysin
LRGIEFRFKEEEGAAEYTEMLAMTMRKHAREDCLAGDYLYEEYDPAEISAVLESIVPSKCLYIVSSNDFDAEAPGVEKERWFNVPLLRTPVDPAKISAWESANPDPALVYPPRNQFIASSFDIKGGSKSRVGGPDAPAPLVVPPEIVHECGAMRLWHRLDDRFDQPRVNAYFHVTLPAIDASAEAYVCADMLTLCVHDRLQDTVRYPAELASLNAGLDVVGQHTMLSLTFDGFHDKLPNLVKAYFEAVADFDVTDSRFEKIKEKRLKDFKNYGLKAREAGAEPAAPALEGTGGQRAREDGGARAGHPGVAPRVCQRRLVRGVARRGPRRRQRHRGRGAGDGCHDPRDAPRRQGRRE